MTETFREFNLLISFQVVFGSFLLIVSLSEKYRVFTFLIALFVLFHTHLYCCRINESPVCLAFFFKMSRLRMFFFNSLVIQGDFFFPTLLVLGGACLSMQLISMFFHVGHIAFGSLLKLTSVHICCSKSLMYYSLLKFFMFLI